jgi:hypothetical protein
MNAGKFVTNVFNGFSSRDFQRFLSEIQRLGYMFISFASPKEMNQRKGARKRQPQPVCPPAVLS